MEEDFSQFRNLEADVGAREIAEFLTEAFDRDDGLGHRPMTTGAANVAEPPPHEFPGVPGIPEVPHAHDERAVDHACDDRPLHVFELQEEISGVGDEVFAWRFADESAEHLLAHDPALARACHIFQPLERDFRPLHLADERRVGQRIEERERLEIHPVGVAGEEQRVRLDRVEHCGRRALRDVHVDGPEMLGQDRGR